MAPLPCVRLSPYMGLLLLHLSGHAGHQSAGAAGAHSSIVRTDFRHLSEVSVKEVRLWGTKRRLTLIIDLLLELHGKVNDMARTEQELSDDLDTIAAGVSAAVGQIADLKAQIAALGNQTAPSARTSSTP